MKKKIIYGFGALTAIAAPMGLVIACGGRRASSNAEAQRLEHIRQIFGNEAMISNIGQTQDEKWGLGNFKDSKATLDESKNLNEYKTRMMTGQPFSLHFHPRDLQIWDKKNDADGAFNKSTIPLANREWAIKVLDSQINKNLDVLAGFNNNTSGTFQGTTQLNYEDQRVFSMWSNINSIVSWGGSATEGQMIVPRAEDINAAHKNGVPILGNAFFPPKEFGGVEEMYHDLTKKVDGKYIVADKMVELAKYYGFDGWFLNFETPIESSDLADELANFGDYLYKKCKEDASHPLYINAYDLGAGGAILHKNNFDTTSLDYNERRTIKTTQDNGIDDEKESYGYDFGNGGISGSDEGGPWNLKDPNAEAYVGNKNAWIYTYFKGRNSVEGEDFDLKFFSNSKGARDPRIDDGDDWYEPGKIYNQRTVISDRKSFHTTFQTGWGRGWNENGAAVELSTSIKQDGWKNSGIQSIQPTWKYINDLYENSDTTWSHPLNRNNGAVSPIALDNVNWKVTIDEGDAWHGATKLHYTGKLDANKTIINKLYASNFTTEQGDQFTAIAKKGNVMPKLALWVEGNDNPFILDAATNQDLANNFAELHYELPANLVNKKIVSFGLAITNSTNAKIDVDAKVSSLNYNVAGSTKELQKMTSITDDGDFQFRDARNIRINWQMEKPELIDHYVIYGSKTFDKHNKDYVLGITSNQSAYLTNVEKNSNLPITIVAYDASGNIVAENKTVIATRFHEMNDMSKWNAKFEVNEGQIAKSIGHNITTSFKDKTGTIYFADDNASLYAINRSGQLLNLGTDNWGIPLEQPSQNIKVRNIFDYDDKNILVFTSSGKTFLVDKATAAVSKEFNSSKFYQYASKLAASTLTQANAKDLLSRISYVEKIGDKLVVFGTLLARQDESILTEDGGYGFGVVLSANGDVTPIASMPANMKFDQIIKTGEGKYAGVVHSKDALKMRQAQLVEFTIDANGNVIIPTIDWAKELKQQLLPFITGDLRHALEQATGYVVDPAMPDFARGNTPGSIDEPALFANAEIQYMQKVGDKYLLINSQGLAIIVASDGTVEKAVSLVTPEEWKAMMLALDAAPSSSSRQGPVQKNTDRNVMMLLNNSADGRQRMIGDESIILENDMLSFNVATSIDATFTGSKRRFVRTTKQISVSSIMGAQGVAFLQCHNAASGSSDVQFKYSINDFSIWGYKNGDIKVINKEGNPVGVGTKLYLYDGKLQMSLDFLYNDGNLEIPEQLMK